VEKFTPKFDETGAYTYIQVNYYGQFVYLRSFSFRNRTKFFKKRRLSYITFEIMRGHVGL